jgi:uncharacterized protein (TIGR03086 family)
MTSPPAWANVPDGLPGAELLERAVGYTRATLQLVAAADLRAPTPCAGWDLTELLGHMDDSLAAFTEAAEIGYVDLVPVAGDHRDHGNHGDHQSGVDVVERLRGRACALLAAWSREARPGEEHRIGVSADRELRSDVLAAAGAVEITVHGWDVARACGADRPVPAALALELLDVVPVLVQDADRPQRFAAPLDVPLHASPGARLLAALGREPTR